MLPKEWAAKAKTLANKMDSLNQRLLKQVAIVTIGPVKKRTPVRTGALRNSLHDTVTPTRATIGTNLSYAAPVNERTDFMGQGFEDAKPRIQELLKDHGKTIIGGLS